jgi:hypothetical protein
VLFPEFLDWQQLGIQTTKLLKETIVLLHILAGAPCAKSLFHVGKSWNNSRRLSERAHIT